MREPKPKFPAIKHPIRKWYEKGFLLAVEKPAGIPVHATFDPNRPNLEDLVRQQEKEPELRLLHRLDKDTSGILLFCKEPSKNKEADSILADSEKTYLAICAGIPKEKEFRVECFLKDGKGKVSSVRSGGKKAITDFTLLSYSKEKNISLVAAKLVTGRRHQIRFHLSSIGTPILGDETYCDSSSKSLVPKPKRFLLHSYLLKFKNEFNEEVKLISELPSDFQPYMRFFSGIRFPE
ncbi:RluA family pseudouridine synthase [Leptospira sp. WS58.C1]|uniref:RluA family pseudouridine synthase n=1 Tax=Leptospira TaxID=171 RepID=UPI0002BEB18C|nr:MULTISPECIES: RNA pseudouridine synthase [unclassified Leptospira]EMK02262.1 pseudouridine synthase, RluA family [Leptospira sp. B5-022]MCR1793580.1 RNA pseudouridine synthase [Leptospira sp. id769339]